VAFVNSYPMDRCRQWWLDGQIPGHLIWGAQHLGDHHFEVDYVQHEKLTMLRRLRLGPFSWLDQQLRLIFRQTDIIYSGHYANVTLLSYLRSRRILRKPLVCTVFMPPDNRAFFRRAYYGHDAFICLSHPLAAYLIEEQNVPADRVFVVPWGTDLPFYGEWQAPPSDGPPLFVATGKTDRDYQTLVQAVDGLPMRLDIHCTNPDLSISVPDNVVFRSSSAVSYPELLTVLRRASGVLIPTHAVSHMAGQTSLLDALGAGRASVMTRNPLVDIDLEALGAGILVDPYDVAAWRRALERLIADPSLTREMGRRARRAAEDHLNLRRFAGDLAAVLRTVLARSH